MKLFQKKNKSTKKNSTKTIFAITLVICIILIIIISSIEPEKVQINEAAVTRRNISVVEVMPRERSSKIQLFGESVPEWKSVIKSQTEGKIIKVSPEFRVGAKVEKGQILLQIEDTQYTALVAEAEVRLATAKINLLLEQKEFEEAKANWERSEIKGEPSSPLVLRKPYLEAAEKEYNSAKTYLEKTKLDLSYTKVKAPFNGIVAERYINLGESINPGEPVLTFYGTEKSLIMVHLTNQQWKLLSGNPQEVKARLFERETGFEWKARVARDGKRLEEANRLRTLILEVDNPLNKQNPLLFGTFLNVELTGKKLNDIVSVSESALTKGGFIWYVNKKNELQSIKIRPHYYLDGKIYFSLPEYLTPPLKIAVNPNSTYMNGLIVETKKIEEEV